MNYKSFGFTKIVPRIPEDKFAAVVAKSANAANAVPLFDELNAALKELDADDSIRALVLTGSERAFAGEYASACGRMLD